jgi:asparagine synthase (glutamine-hydrolysing)
LPVCGIAGLLDLGASTRRDALVAAAAAMGETLRHRGPDDEGLWVDESSGVAFAHRRLSIIDLSELGHQPMQSGNGRYVLTYNGEIYNYLELRKELEELGHGFRGHSDTEVLLAAFIEWGIRSALQRANGMFALAVWDSHEHELHLARDRFGEKPLYFGLFGDIVLFASELKALWGHPNFSPSISNDAVALYARHGYVPAPHSIFREISKLEPGTHLVHPARRGAAPRVEPYWSLVDVARRGLEDQIVTDEVSATDGLEAILRDAVGIRMVADVPLGAMLSGGIDSSTVVALMQTQSTLPVRTFSIGFSEADYDEAPYARAVARHLGTDHTELYVTPEQTMAVIPTLPTMYDEPFADSSQIPTFLVSKLARSQVTVALSGDGGDELFGGYTRYRQALRLEQLRRVVPAQLAAAGARAIRQRPSEWWNGLWSRTAGKVTRRDAPLLGHRLHRVADLLDHRDSADVYVDLVSYWRPEEGVLRRDGGVAPPLQDRLNELPDARFGERMMLADALTYLPDDILTKVDRASMAVSLEARVPLLDPNIAEFAWRLPRAMRLGRVHNKILLRRVLDRYVPSDLVDRPKSGFGIPIDRWLRGDLREWAEDLLAPDRLASDGYFEPAVVERYWQEHLEGHRAWHYRLWPILMFSAWLRELPRHPVHA